MTEMGKTLIYVGLAAVALVAAIATRPRSISIDHEAMANKELFEAFKDPASAKRLRIVRYLQDQGELKEFEVRQVDGRWVLPSNSNYPADAENRIRDAATQFVGLRAIGLLSNDESSHATYGVLEPNEANRRSAAKGVGTLLEMEDATGTRFRLIVGQEVKDQQGQRYVRLPGQSAVYVANIDLTKFPATFEEWINRDLLDIDTFNIARIVLKDYSVSTGMRPDGSIAALWDQRFSLSVHEDQGKWVLDDLQEFDEEKRELVAAKLADEEELNSDRLNALRTALTDLVIVGVERKPEGLRADLTADADFLANNESSNSLIDRGFYPIPMPDGHVELLSSDGEVIVQMKDGVEYVLRFGGVSGGGTQEAGGTQLHRYLFVSARVNKDLIPEPELEEFPESPSGDSAAATEAAAADVSESAGGDQTPESAQSAGESTTIDSDTAATADKPATDSADAGAEAAESDADADAGEQLEAERARIVRDNQRKKDEYNEKLAQAETKKNDVNYRFADWYYMISDDVYKKIHLSRSDVISAKGQPSDGIGAARDLLNQGLEGPTLDDFPVDPPGGAPDLDTPNE